MSEIVGLDIVCHAILNGAVRTGMVNGQQCGSLVDTIGVFKPNIKNPRQWWKDHKKQILAKDPDEGDFEPNSELVENLYQLKLEAEDGKLRLTDVAPDWVLVYVGLTINQEFRMWMAKNAVTPAEVRYRMGMFARTGGGFATDTIHKEMATLEVPPVEDPDTEIGYQR